MPMTDKATLDHKYLMAAKKHVKDGELEVDDDARVSGAVDDGIGAYVQAWIWISADELEEPDDG